MEISELDIYANEIREATIGSAAVKQEHTWREGPVAYDKSTTIGGMILSDECPSPLFEMNVVTENNVSDNNSKQMRLEYLSNGLINNRQRIMKIKQEINKRRQKYGITKMAAFESGYIYRIFNRICDRLFTDDLLADTVDNKERLKYLINELKILESVHEYYYRDRLNPSFSWEIAEEQARNKIFIYS